MGGQKEETGAQVGAGNHGLAKPWGLWVAASRPAGVCLQGLECGWKDKAKLPRKKASMAPAFFFFFLIAPGLKKYCSICTLS